ncbi:hypothetical protein RSSM_05657 [Rhodopirellula sallentina SM41]|uniref:Uncharacterized protein n=1 Tax=Rhodopirellula sallentina SM41 TaxID=1263870 RepID=M5TUT7_9BACT|nr:hypothetical protein RSSM_05657 [Rhodopirellula sallentina SM41]
MLFSSQIAGNRVAVGRLEGTVRSRNLPSGRRDSWDHTSRLEKYGENSLTAQ